MKMLQLVPIRPADSVSQASVRGVRKIASAARPCRAESTSQSAAGAHHRVRWARISHGLAPMWPINWNSRGTKPQIV
jgi:hypothetical protein